MAEISGGELLVRSDGPAVVCLRTDRDANQATPQDPGLRFFEVYNGPIG